MLSVIIIFAAHIEDKPSTKSAFASVLQMFTHVSPSPFVRAESLERCENEDSLAVVCSLGSSDKGRMQRSGVDVCLTDKPG
jgi:hypothetical protein